MAQWTLDFTTESNADLERLNSEIRKRILKKIEWLVLNFDTITPVPLLGEWKGFFKLRITDWRIIYEINYERYSITVHLIDRRDKIYKRRIS